ncbi:TetR/AcrR family transcriptional regulator [Skermania piniformis]|uniref:TetR/AcrR family transcriptional regulator n=1 Tax=Skermania pinensis TaxID=39122 RepID=A0ABX8S7J7_9ACTN|nr:TetR/AcrR family transcriptional regulator [Skermania piniformis]QXQ13784.1 TetR/AcrR family transcriptional regulator [Skermania piniformis]
MSGVGLVAQLLAAAAPDEDDPAVLDGAFAAFLDFGIRRTTMAEIARRSGVSAATLYRRYPGKDAVIRAVLARESRRFVRAVDARVDRTATAREQVVAAFVAFTTELSGNQLLRRLLTTEPESTLPLLTTEAGPVLAVGREYVRGDLARLQATGGLPAFDVEPVAEIFARLALSLALTPDGVIPVEDAAAAAEFARAHITALVRL